MYSLVIGRKVKITKLPVALGGDPLERGWAYTKLKGGCKEGTGKSSRKCRKLHP